MGVVVWVFYMVRSTLFRGVFRQNPGSKYAKSQICTRALEFYISKYTESESTNGFVIRQELGASKIEIFDRNSRILVVFVVFRGESERTGSRRFDIRNLHVRIYPPASRLPSDLLRARVAGGWCSAILVAIFDFSKSRKNFNPELTSKVLELPESHWTSPLGPLDGCCDLVLSKWCEALSSGRLFGKIRGQNMQSHRFAREHWNSTFQPIKN